MLQNARDNYRRGKHTRRFRSQLITVNIVLVLVVVIVAMIVQISSIGKKSDKQKDNTEAQVSVSVAPEETEAPPEETAEPRIRTDLDATKPMVALTFDDGPYDVVTNRLVKMLDKYNGRATFFAVGNRVDMYADTLKNAYDHGNQIGTHTYSHCDLSKLKKSGIEKEMNKSSRKIKKITGTEPSMLRPPYGNINDKMRKTVKMPMIYWSVDTEDWKSRNKKKIIKECRNIEDGDIVLMHDLYTTTADAVAKLAPILTKKGFQLVTLEELYYYKGIELGDGKVYVSAK